jgi:hypothetical protein
MKIDRYTKIVLTIIAICLINLSLGGINLFPQAQANVKTSPDVSYGLVPLNEDGSITVRLSEMEEIDVNITDISTSDELHVDISEISTSDELDINIDEVGGSFLHLGSGIPVKIKD